MQDVCISLEVTDPTSLPAAVSKLLRVIASLPRLERFVGEVCEVTQLCSESYTVAFFKIVAFFIRLAKLCGIVLSLQLSSVPIFW